MSSEAKSPVMKRFLETILRRCYGDSTTSIPNGPTSTSSPSAGTGAALGIPTLDSSYRRRYKLTPFDCPSCQHLLLPDRFQITIEGEEIEISLAKILDAEGNREFWEPSLVVPHDRIEETVAELQALLRRLEKDAQQSS